MTGGTSPNDTSQPPYRPHLGESRQYLRDIILGVNDGLVSIFLLVAGVVGGGLTTSQAALTALAGAVAGAVSMAAGEYLATRSQDEVFDREIALEREHIMYFRKQEVDQLEGFLSDIGVNAEHMDAAVAALSHDDETLLNAMKVLEFGIVDSERRSAVLAMLASGALFLLGALPPTLPFLLGMEAFTALLWSGVLTSIALFLVGWLQTTMTDGNPLKSGTTNLVIAGVGGIGAYAIGTLIEQILA